MKLSVLRQRPFTAQSLKLFSLLLFVAALWPRLAGLTHYITPDELNWVHRSTIFHQALRQGAWASTLTTGHPGVLSTWLGALGIQVQLWLRPSDITAYQWITHLAWLAPENTAAFPQLATFLSAGRTAVAIANSLGVVAIFGLGRRLVGEWPAAVAVGLLALDPFVAGLSGLLHVDGLMTTFTTISLLALGVALAQLAEINRGAREERREKPLKNPRLSASIRVPFIFTAVSGATAACAILTKSAALTLIPFTGLAFIAALLAWRSQWRKIILFGLIWLGAMVAIQFVLLPALWSDPIGSYQTIIGTIFHETEEVLPPTFFMGQVSQAHGAIFYPVALLFRLNPLVLIGLLLGGWFGWQKRAERWWQRPFHLISIIWPIFFMLILTLATKKYDRYLLPALPLLFFLAALGWNHLLQKRPSLTQPVTMGGILLALVYLATAVPYLLNAYNPLVGGRLTAKQIMPMGWGEAASAAAQWLAEQPNAAQKTAVAGIGPAFAPFFPGKTILRDGDNWREADFVVETLGGYQDSYFGAAHLRFEQTLLHVIRYDGADQAWIFANNNPVAPDITWQPQDSQFGGQIELVRVGTAVRENQLDVYVQWQRVQPVDSRFNVQLHLLDEDDQLWAQLEMPLLNEVYFYPQNWQPDEQPIWRYSLELPPGMPPATYHVDLSLFAAESGAQLPVVGADGRFAGVTQTIAERTFSPPPLFHTEAVALGGTPQPLLGGALTFLGQSGLPESALTASSVAVDLFWQAMADLPANLQLQFWLDERPLATLPLSRFATDLWQPMQIIHEKYRLPIPADLAAGTYDLRLELVANTATPINLGMLNIVSPDRLFSLPNDVGQPVMLRFGDLVSLRGVDLQTETAAPGNPVQLTLFWQVNRQPGEIYSTFLHLVGPDGQIVAQGDQWPGGLPGSTWAEGQVIIDQYAIQLPADAPLGSYQIVLGLYAPANGLRLPITAEDGAALGDQFVLPLLLEVAR